MTDQSSWENDLKDTDGSCRDVNLSEHLSREAALALLDAISTEWMLHSAANGDGSTASPSNFSALVGIGEGSLSTLWSGGSLIKQLQCYLYWNPGDGVFSELTFFPDDIIEDRFSLQRFTTFLSNLLAITHSTEYYVRYENASWRHGDASSQSGVIFSHHDLPLGGG